VTTAPGELPIRAATADDFDDVWRTLGRAFTEDFDPDTATISRALFEPERNLVATDGGRVVANAGAYTRDLTVPGAVVPAAHVTLVGVHPVYRRRGLLTRLMHRQLRDAREAGEAVAVLWASEGRIYQRFGYGPAAARYRFEADLRNLTFLPLPASAAAVGLSRLREADPPQARKELVDLFERVRPTAVGLSSRDERWWDRILDDRKDFRNGATARRALLYDGPDGVDGYALWRTKSDWDDSGPNGRTEVRELLAATPEAYAALTRFLFSVDLTRKVEFWSMALDEPLMYLVDEPRTLGARRFDSLWIRLTDVPAALTARRYCAPLDVVLEVSDAIIGENAGRWRLRSAGPAAVDVTCQPAAGMPADVALDVADLGTAYLGGATLAALAAAGRVRELRPGALAPLSTAFGWVRQPMTIEIF
jgi:predicted acetyltransferase